MADLDPAAIMRERALSVDDRVSLECLADALRATGKAGGAAWIEAALEDLDRLAEALAAEQARVARVAHELDALVSRYTVGPGNMMRVLDLWQEDLRAAIADKEPSDGVE